MVSLKSARLFARSRPPASLFSGRDRAFRLISSYFKFLGKASKFFLWQTDRSNRELPCSNGQRECGRPAALPRRDNVCPRGNSSADESPLLREERATFARCEPSAFDPKRTSELQTDNPQRRAIRRNGSADGRIVPLPFGGPSAWQHRFDDRRVECLVVMQANHVV